MCFLQPRSGEVEVAVQCRVVASHEVREANYGFVPEGGAGGFEEALIVAGLSRVRQEI